MFTTVFLIHQPGSLLGICINRPEIGKSSPQGAAVKPAVLRICPNTGRQFLVMTLKSPALWNLNVTCPYLTHVPLVETWRHLQRAGYLTSAQVLTSGWHKPSPRGHAAGRTQGDTQTYIPNAQVAQLLQRTPPPLAPRKVNIFLDGTHSRLVSLSTIPIWCSAGHMSKTEPSAVQVRGCLGTSWAPPEHPELCTTHVPPLQRPPESSPTCLRSHKAHTSFPNEKIV